MAILKKEQITERRREIEEELVDKLKEVGSDFSLQDVKDIIYHEEDNDDMTKIIAMFDRGGDISELNDILELVSDAWNYFPHKTLGGLSPAEMMLRYEKEDKKKKPNAPAKNKKLTVKQKDLLWSGGGKGPYSQANLKRQVRILDDSISRIFMVVETEINPTTFEIIKENRNDDKFNNDTMIQQLLDHAEYRGPQFGYVATAFEEEYTDDEVMVRAEHALKYVQECIIKMHKYIMGNFGS